MKNIRVAFFAEILTDDFDGAVRTMFQLIKRINNAEFQYLFIYGVGPDLIEGHESLKIPAIALPVNTTYSIALPVLAQSRLKRKLRDFAPDVVHISTPSLLGGFALNYAIQNHLPTISIYHTHFISYVDYYFKHTPFLISGIKNKLTGSLKAFYNRCDKVYIPAESIRQELLETGIDRDRMQIWKRGIDTALFSPGKKDPRVMIAISGNKKPTILFASRLVWEKNLETLFSIYDELQLRNFPVNFLIAGDGTARKDCEERMPKAIFTGKVDHQRLSVLYASADVFLFPSVTETYGNVVLEAMSSGLPCVIADGGGSKDFIEQGLNGFKCSPNDAIDYVDKIELILSDLHLRDQFINEGLACSQQLSWDKLARQYFADIRLLAHQPMPQLACFTPVLT
jgi:glycosyltransferase involved in cell wall biosynthesis